METRHRRKFNNANQTVSLRLDGMGCAACATTIEKAIQNVPGVQESSVNFALERTTVQYNPQVTNLEIIQQAVADAGYSAYSLEDLSPDEHEDSEKATRQARQRELT